MRPVLVSMDETEHDSHNHNFISMACASFITFVNLDCSVPKPRNVVFMQWPE